MALLESIIQSRKADMYCTEWKDGAPAGFYENICGLLNAFGGDVYIGISEDGKVTGMDEDMARELGKALNHDLWDGGHIVPGCCMYRRKYLYVVEGGTLCGEPGGGKTVLYFYVPMSGSVHSVSGRTYDRTENGNVDITDDAAALLHLKLRKSGERTELRYSGAMLEDLDTDTIRRLHDMAVAKRQDHPWREWTDEEIVRSLGLIYLDPCTGERSYPAGALLLFGKDESLHRLLPEYGTDMVLRAADGTEKTERISCNLFKAYDRLMVFAHENISRFRDADAAQAEALDRVLRGLVVNFLVHREHMSPLPARFIISTDSVCTENGNDAGGLGEVAADFMSAYPDKRLLNALLMAFGEAGLADRFSTGLREMTEDSAAFASKPPVFTEGNTFRATVYTA